MPASASCARREPRRATSRLPLTLQIGCDGGLSCDDLTVSARELIDGGPPALLASGVAHVEHGLARSS